MKKLDIIEYKFYCGQIGEYKKYKSIINNKINELIPLPRRSVDIFINKSRQDSEQQITAEIMDKIKRNAEYQLVLDVENTISKFADEYKYLRNGISLIVDAILEWCEKPYRNNWSIPGFTEKKTGFSYGHIVRLKNKFINLFSEEFNG